VKNQILKHVKSQVTFCKDFGIDGVSVGTLTIENPDTLQTFHSASIALLLFALPQK